jgi:hypothetical protein
MQLDDNKAVFDFVLAQTIKSFKVSNYLEASAWAGIAGQCASNSHAGFYVHAQLEKMLLQIGKSLDHKTINSEIKVAFNQNNNLKILHVFSAALPIGGHTRLAERWISNRLNQAECHSVLLLDQNYIRIPEWLKAAAEKSGGSCVPLPDYLNIIERALMLRKIAYEAADIVVLHTHPNDPVPLIAFAIDSGPPIILLNHADHLFWFNSSIADLVADIRLMAQQLTLQKRKITNSLLLPIPLLPKKQLNKTLCRKELHLPDDKIILLAIASSYKFKPYNNSDFPKIVSAFVEAHPNTILIVIGPSPDEINWQNAIETTDGRVQVLGIVENIDNYYGAADIYLESFPVGSITSTLDAMLHELPVIQAPAPLFPLLHVDKYIGMQGNAPDIDHYYDSIFQCVDDSDFRLSLGKTQRLSVESMHIGSGWQKYIDNIMDNVPSSHTIKSIADNDNIADITDITLADLHSKSVLCDKSALLSLINALRAHSKYIKHHRLFITLLHALILFGISNSKVFWFDLIKTIGSIGLPTRLYQNHRRAHLKKIWG